LAYKVIFSKQAIKDLQKLKQAGLERQVKVITEILKQNPYQTPPRFERLIGDLHDYFSRRINIQHQYIYKVLPNDSNLQNEGGEIYTAVVHVLRMWTHYE